MQIKKSQYEIYSTMMSGEIKAARQAFKSELPKSASNSDVLAVFIRREPEILQTLNLHIMAEEYFWQQTSAHTLFPQDHQVLNDLMSGDFHISDAKAFTLPLQSFMMSMPQGYEVDGVRIPSFLVTWIPYRRTQELIVGPFAIYARSPKAIHVRLEDTEPDEVSISLCYRDPISHTAYARTHMGTGDISGLLKAKTPDELSNSLMTYQKLLRVEELSAHDLKIQSIMLKLVAALGAHYKATDGACLKPGYPAGQEPKFLGRPPETPITAFTLADVAG
jgi:hypothetical protein